MDNPERMWAIHQQARETMELVRQETDKRMNAMTNAIRHVRQVLATWRGMLEGMRVSASVS